MSWSRSDGMSPLFRVALTVDSSASAASGDVEIEIPVAFSHFWKNIDSSGNELRVTASDGESLLIYQLKAGFSKADRVGYIQIDNFAPSEAATFQIWLYYGMEGAASKAGSFVYAASKSGYLYAGAPGAAIRGVPQRPGDTTPREVVSKGAAEQRWVWFDLSALLQGRFSAADGFPQFEELHSVTYAVYAAGVAQAGMVDAASPRFVEGRFVQVLVKGGTTGTDYTIVVTVKTRIPPITAAQVVEVRALLKVRDVQE